MRECIVPSCEGEVDWDPHADASGGLCPACVRSEAYARRSMEDLHLMRLDDVDGGTRYATAMFPPRPKPAPAILPDPEKWGDPDGSPYGLAALRGIMEDLSAVSPGTPNEQGIGRNNALSKAAHRCGQLVGGGELQGHVARSALRFVAAQLGLSPREYEPLIRRRLQAGQDNPRSAPERQAA